MEASLKLTMILNELIELRKYINTLKNDGTINHYTAGTMISKLDRCEDIAQNKVLSKNQ